MHPVHEQDTKETIKLVSDYLSGNYQFGRKDFPFLFNDDQEVGSNQKDFENQQPRKLDDFQMKLPAHLRGKRPRDMDKNEKTRIQ